MAKVTQAYEQGIVNQVTKRPILTTLLVGGIGYFIFTKLSKKVAEVVDEKQKGIKEDAEDMLRLNTRCNAGSDK